MAAAPPNGIIVNWFCPVDVKYIFCCISPRIKGRWLPPCRMFLTVVVVLGFVRYEATALVVCKSVPTPLHTVAYNGSAVFGSVILLDFWLPLADRVVSGALAVSCKGQWQLVPSQIASRCFLIYLSNGTYVAYGCT